MKTLLYSALVIFGIAASGLAANTTNGSEPPSAITGELQDLSKKVSDDLTAGTLSKPDADELQSEINQMATEVSNLPTITATTRRTFETRIGRIKKDIALREAQAGASHGDPTP